MRLAGRRPRHHRAQSLCERWPLTDVLPKILLTEPAATIRHCITRCAQLQAVIWIVGPIAVRATVARITHRFLQPNWTVEDHFMCITLAKATLPVVFASDVAAFVDALVFIPLFERDSVLLL